MAKKVFTEEEARERKNARQREYAKKTHYAAQTKYKKENYTRLIVDVKMDVAEAFKEKCRKQNVPYSRVITNFIEVFLKKN